jgi:hypothetical protein
MNQPLTVLRRQWQSFQALRYPHGRPDAELGTVDFGDLIELDSAIAGWVSRIAGGGALSTSDLARLASVSAEVKSLLPSLSGATRAYFVRLVELSESAQVANGKAP